jgi:hypothetical protein
MRNASADGAPTARVPAVDDDRMNRMLLTRRDDALAARVEHRLAEREPATAPDPLSGWYEAGWAQGGRLRRPHDRW